MSRIDVYESVGSRREDVDRYSDLEHHHPGRRLAEPGRMYGDIDGRSEELLKDTAAREPLRSSAGDYFVSKDFVLRDANDSRAIGVPAPAAGYIDGLDDRWGRMQIWSGPKGDPDRVMIAQVLHLDPASFKQRKEGDRIEYGEPMGTQSGRGPKDGVVSNGTFPAHVHIDINTRYIGQLDRYLQDLNSGVITTETRPAPSENVVSPAPAVTNLRDGRGNPVVPVDPLADGALSRGEKGDAVGALQTQLRSLGYTNARGEPVVVDKDFGPGTEHALKQFQTDKALPVTGIADEATRQAIDRSVREALRDLPPTPAQAPQRQEPSSKPAQRVEDALYAPLRDQVYAMDRAIGRTPDEASDRVAAALTAEWRANGLTARPDGVVLGQKGGSAQPGEYVFAYSGSSERPSDWVGVKTAEAVQTPVDQSLAKAETLQRQQAMEAQQMAQAQQASNDAPARAIG